MREPKRLTFPDRASWLEGRQNGIGASEAAAVLGESPFTTATKLWRLKTGLDKPRDLSGKTVVERGNRMEPALRTMFQALYPELTLEYHQFDMLYQADKPYLYATLDGELLTKDHRRGVLEIKTATMSNALSWDRWRDAVPDHYYIQILHQLLATGYSFAVLFAALFDLHGGISLRTYAFKREECQEDMDYLAEKETEFWKHVEDGTLPSLVLSL